VEAKFVIDINVGRLARWLRMMGYDAILFHELDDGLMVKLAGKGQQGFSPQVVFEGATRYLKKLQCHTTALDPGASYPPHADSYDVAMFILDGEVRTLGQHIKAPGVIFYKAGTPHGIYNPAECTAKYLVFEFRT
jgi:quercetin dioxygenase-like cupin family protein